MSLEIQSSTTDRESEIRDPEQSSYRQIFKATSLFGGVQVFQILIGIIRNKFVAVLLGTTGVGLIGLFNAPLQLVLLVTGLGLTFSAVRDISEAYGSNDQRKIAEKVTTLRRWTWATAILGLIVTAGLAPLLSKWTFGNNKYTLAFLWLSFSIFFQIIGNNQRCILQAARRLKDLARANVYGSIVGLITSVPLFYFLRLQGIVPSLILASITLFLISWFYSRRVRVQAITMSFKETYNAGKSMVKLGMVITATGVVSYITGYILNAYIGRTGGVEQVGLYNAGWSVIMQSTGLVFTAMTTDYYPRLSAINNDNSKIRQLVNQQAVIALFILAPIIIILITILPFLIRLLYTAEFLPVVILASWMLVGIILKGMVWPVGYIFPAKNDMKLFGVIEISAMLFNIIINIIGYNLYGLEGLGISYIIGYIYGLGVTNWFAYKKYGFTYSKETIRIFLISLLLICFTFGFAYLLKGSARYAIGLIFFTGSLFYSFFGLDKRLKLKQLVLSVSAKLMQKRRR